MIKAIHIFHHNDLDGRLSAALLYQYFKKHRREYNKTIMHEVNYSNNIDLDVIPTDDVIAFVDFSFSEDKNWNTFISCAELKLNPMIWIDHHKSSENKFDYFRNKMAQSNGAASDFMYDRMDCDKESAVFYYSSDTLEVFYTQGYCATVGVWLWCNGKINNNRDFLDVSNANLTKLVKYADSYDLWKMNQPNTIQFNYGMINITTNPKKMLAEMGFPTDMDFFDASNKKYCIEEDKIIESIISEGEIVDKYVQNHNEFLRRCTSIKFLIKHKDRLLTGIAMNSPGNSLMFGPEYDAYHVVVPFYMTSEGTWKYSMFAKDDPKECDYFFDCGDIAEILGKLSIGCNGGGHAQAAGFVLSKQILRPYCEIEIRQSLFGKYYIRITYRDENGKTKMDIYE